MGLGPKDRKRVKKPKLPRAPLPKQRSEAFQDKRKAKPRYSVEEDRCQNCGEGGNCDYCDE